MTYYRRWSQLINTLRSFNYDDCVVIIVNDDPTVRLEISDTHVININVKTWTNPEPAYNYGILKALEFDPEIIILQNAECYHAGDIVSYAKANLTDDNYISFGCYSLSSSDKLPPKILNNRGASFDGESAWYNHPVYRPAGYDFCSAIKTSNLKKLNGYDERFSFGVGYGDDYLIKRIKMFLKAEITSSPIVYHQWHPHSEGREELIEANRKLFSELSPEIRAIHLITPDL